MTLQTIKSLDGKDEYVLLPVAVFRALQETIEDELAGLEASASKGGDYIPFEVENYVNNPVALARIKARVTQEELAKRLGVTQAYISKVENQDKVTAKLVERVAMALRKK